MGGYKLEGVNSVWGYACPFCEVVVLDAGLSTPVRLFEAHLDHHFATATTTVRGAA